MYRYLRGDNSYFAGNLSKNEEGDEIILEWNCTGGCGVLFVYDETCGTTDFDPEKICELLNNKAIGNNYYKEDDDFVGLGEDICVRYLSPIDSLDRKLKVSKRGRYIILACREKDGERIVYEPQGVPEGYYIDIYLKVRVKIEEEKKEIKSGLLRRTSFEPSGFYSIEFMENFNINQYRDGEMYYTVDNVKIPITAKMIKEKKIFIKSEIKPEICSDKLEVEVIENWL